MAFPKYEEFIADKKYAKIAKMIGKGGATEEESVSWVDAGTVPTQVYAQDVANVSTSKTSFVDDNGDKYLFW